jgi:hypothetical protein
MSLGLTRYRAFRATVGALLCGFLASTFAAAQSFQLDDLMGLWAVKSTLGSSTLYSVYQATTGPGSLTLRYVRTDTVNPLPGQGQTQGLPAVYNLSVTDRSLSGTVTVGPGTMAGCSFEARMFPVQGGRISPDGNTITIVENHDYLSVYPCEWRASSGESVMQLDRYH